MKIAARGRQRLAGDVADPAHRFDRVGEQITLLGEMIDQRREFGEHPIEGVGSGARVRQQPVGGVDGVDDVVALRVQLAREGVQLAEEIPDLMGTPGQDLVDLVLDDLEVRNAAAAQHHGQAGERLLGRGIGRRVVQRDGVAGLELLWRRIWRCGQFDVLRTQQAGLADLGGGVLRKPDALVQVHGQRGDPVLQVDRTDRADEDVGHQDSAIAVQRHGVWHLNKDLVGARAAAGPTGQRDVGDAAPVPAGGQHHRGGQQRQRLPGLAAHQPHHSHRLSVRLAPRAYRARRAPHWPGPGGASAAPSGRSGGGGGGGAGDGKGCGYHGGGSGLFSS